MSILDIIIMLIGGFLLFWLFATIVIFPILKIALKKSLMIGKRISLK